MMTQMIRNQHFVELRSYQLTESLIDTLSPIGIRCVVRYQSLVQEAGLNLFSQPHFLERTLGRYPSWI